MSMSPRRDTARIYQFPHRARVVALEAQRLERHGPDRAVATGDCGGGWYHEAAIQDEARTRKP